MKNKIRLKEDELRQIIRESVHSQLINEANRLGGGDNITVCLLAYVEKDGDK